VAGTVDEDELAAGRLGERLAPRSRDEAIVGTVDDQHR
jgi:hypothetical protein